MDMSVGTRSPPRPPSLHAGVYSYRYGDDLRLWEGDRCAGASASVASVRGGGEIYGTGRGLGGVEHAALLLRLC